MRCFSCVCGNSLFFENSVCLSCRTEVGFDCDVGEIVAIDENHHRCRNAEFGVCNWIIRAGDTSGYCPACQLNQIIPDLSIPQNVEAWRRLESAKRRVVYTLHTMGLRPESKASAADGLGFSFLAPYPGQPIVTGHAGGIITLNLLEADDVYREAERTRLGEPYRTLVGHFRHETGHYYWDLLIGRRDANDRVVAQWRRLFGDERAPYGPALNRYYQYGPPADWSNSYITAYASSHPWEDWAETWTQYLHIIEGIESARHFGLNATPSTDAISFSRKDIASLGGDVDEDFLQRINEWAQLAPALNEVSTSLGQGTLYPFILSPATIRKIHFVHQVVTAAATAATAAARPPAEPVKCTENQLAPIAS